MSEKKHDWRAALDEVVQEKRRQGDEHPGQEQLVAYHGGRLSPGEEKKVRDHLVLCRRCAQLLLEFDAFASEAGDPALKIPQEQAPTERGRPWWLFPLAAAAALLVAVLAWPSADPLPRYSPRLSGWADTTRDAGPESGVDSRAQVYRFSWGSRMVLRLQPATALETPPTARFYLRRDGSLRALSTSVAEARRDGVVSLQGIIGSDLHLPTGRSQLIAVAARPGWLPSREQLEADAPLGGEGWTGAVISLDVIPPPPGSPAPQAGQRLVEYEGCASVLSGPVCVLAEDRRLTLWVRHEQDSDITIDAGHWRRSYTGTQRDDGLAFRVEVGSAQEVALEILSGDLRRIWVLDVQDPPASDPLGQARQHYSRGEWQETARLLQEQVSAADPALAAEALSLLARVERFLGRPRESEDYYRRALEAHRRAGLLSRHIRDACGLVFYLIQERRFSQGRQLLDSLPLAATGGHIRSRYFQAYYQGLLSEESGDFRRARRGMLRAARAARHGGLTLEEHYADDILARQLAAGGLLDSAQDIYRRMQPQIDRHCGSEEAERFFSACDCARFSVNRAWAGLLAAESGHPRGEPDPAALLSEAERLFTLPQTEDCRRAEDLSNVRLNQALAALQAARPDEARKHLESAGIDPLDQPRLVLWQLDVQARLSLADGDHQAALQGYRSLSRLAHLSASPEAAWRSAIGQARALRQAGETDEAIQSCREAERLLEQEILWVPIDQGRALLAAQREKGSRLCLNLLLQSGGGHEALELIRRSASRALKSMHIDAGVLSLTADQRQRWEETREDYRRTRTEVESLAAQVWEGLPLDQESRLKEEIAAKREVLRQLLDDLAALATARRLTSARGAEEGGPKPGSGTGGSLPEDGSAGERLLLAYHPLPQGWAALASGAGGVAIHQVGELPGREERQLLSDCLLKPFEQQISKAREIRVIAYGLLRTIDFHSLPFKAGILLEQAPVLYHLDLPPTPQQQEGSLSLVVAGPGLLKASDEAAVVERILADRPGREAVRRLEGAEARGPEVRDALARSRLFHYAGHARFDDESRGWDSYLALAEGGRLTVDDILASPRVPRWAVLSGCETGRDAQDAPLPSIGLAQAFLAVGSESVVAATARVSDADAAALGSALYHHWRQPGGSLAQALQAAQLELRENDPRSDWSKFRILSR